MKRVLFAAFCFLVLCSLLVVNTGTIKAAEEGYTRMDYNPDVRPDIDGAWTNDTEWVLNGEVTMISEDAAFQTVWETLSMDPEIIVSDTFLVEFFSDTTDDAGDYWQLCIDGDQSGDTTPQASDYRIDIEGHADLKVYIGNGVDWTETTIDPASIEWADSLSASPTNSTPHWVLELMFIKPDLGAGPDWNFRLAVYDENTSTLLSWPPTPRDEPDRWGVQGYTSGIVPEGFSIGVVVLLSSVAVLVGFYCLRKRSRTESYGSEKTGKINYMR